MSVPMAIGLSLVMKMFLPRGYTKPDKDSLGQYVLKTAAMWLAFFVCWIAKLCL